MRIFHGYATPFGATYNCYLILDGDKKILVDNVKAAFTEEFFRNIEEICPVESLDILIQNHIEPDHSRILRFTALPVHRRASRHTTVGKAPAMS